MLTVTRRQCSPMLCSLLSSEMIFAAQIAASVACLTSDSNITNSSPPWRLTVSGLRTQADMRAATDWRRLEMVEVIGVVAFHLQRANDPICSDDRQHEMA